MTQSLSYGFLIPVVITIIGWFVVARQAERREFRKEVRDRLIELKECTKCVHESCVLYWLNANRTEAPAAAISLKSDLQRLGMQISILERTGLNFSGDSFVAEIRKMATGGDFESARRRKKPKVDAERVATTVGLLEDLVQRAELAFYETYVPLGNNSYMLRFVPFGGLLMLSKDT